MELIWFVLFAIPFALVIATVGLYIKEQSFRDQLHWWAVVHLPLPRWIVLRVNQSHHDHDAQ